MAHTPTSIREERRKDVHKAAMAAEKPGMVTCPGCGKKFSASNQGGASVGGGTAAGAGAGGGG